MKEKIRAAIADRQHQDIVIVGKGPSIDKINTEILKEFIVINTNDSEAIYPGQISVFHHGWVLDRFDNIAPQCRLYISDREMPADVERLGASFVPYSPETADFLLDRFFSDTIYIEQAIIISALRVADEIGRFSSLRKKVYLLGFDFSSKDGFSSKIENGMHGQEESYIEKVISDQEKILQILLMEKKRLSVEVLHIGDKPYSFYSVDAFNKLFENPIPKGKDKIHPWDATTSDNVKVVAEITTNHFGDRQRLQAMIKAAKWAGADYIKLQKRDVETFYTSEQLAKSYKSPFGNTFGDYRRGIELSADDLNFVNEFCAQLGIGWFLSVLDKPSYDFIRDFKPALIKLPSTISEHKDYLREVANTYEGELVISTGFTDKKYEQFILNTFQKANKLYLLQCTSAYPTPMEDAQLGVIRHYYNLAKLDSRIVPGYSSHDIGSLCSMMAVAAGAKMIEKHVKFGDVTWSHFDQVAVDLANGDFHQFVEDIRKAERIVGMENKVIHKSEHHKYLPNSNNK